MDKQIMLDKAIQVTKNSYCPYSKYRVGCCLETKDGMLFTGCNVESASYGATICAERVALTKAVSEGYREFHSMVIYAASDTMPIPCGICRQLLSEFSDIDIYVFNKNKEEKHFKLSELIPQTFKL